MPSSELRTADAENVSRNRERTVLIWRCCWAFFFVSTFVGTVVYYRAYAPQRHEETGSTEQAAAAQVSGDTSAIIAAIERTHAYVKDNLHQAPVPVQAISQVSLVVGIAFTWFFAFLLVPAAHKPTVGRAVALPGVLARVVRPFHSSVVIIGSSIVPALIFIGAMYQAYQPAVFVMALVAIFVAAEHYGRLKETGDEFQKAFESVKAQTGILLNADGLARWRANVYEQYKAAVGRIDAVVRHFDIDECFLNQELSDDLWRCCAGSSGMTVTLYRALTERNQQPPHRANAILTLWRILSESDENPPRRTDAIVAWWRSLAEPEEDPPFRTDAVQFVMHLPLPSPERAEYFEALWGLTWQLVVLDLVRTRRREDGSSNSEVDARFADSPSWMHAIDDCVFQVLDRTNGDASARELTREIAVAQRRPLSRWAHEDVQRSANRGCHAEEYVCSVFRYEALKHGLSESAQLNQEIVEEVLEDIGLNAWVGKWKQRGWSEAATTKQRRLCVATFEKFFEQRLAAAAWPDLTVHPSGKPSVSDLLLELI